MDCAVAFVVERNRDRSDRARHLRELSTLGRAGSAISCASRAVSSSGNQVPRGFFRVNRWPGAANLIFLFRPRLFDDPAILGDRRRLVPALLKGPSVADPSGQSSGIQLDERA